MSFGDSFTPAVVPGIGDVVDDTTPQLGGDLDLNSKNFDFPSTPNVSDCLDEDDMSSNSATALATQQSIKAYSDSGIQTLTNKTFAAESNTATVFTEAHATSHTLTASECYGGVYYVTGAATLTLPAVAAGMQVTVYTVGAIAVSVKAGASDKIWLDGTALDDGDKITNTSTSGDVAVLTYYSADGWYASTNTWTDGGA